MSARALDRALFGASPMETLAPLQADLNRTSELVFACVLHPGLYDLERRCGEAPGL